MTSPDFNSFDFNKLSLLSPQDQINFLQQRIDSLRHNDNSRSVISNDHSARLKRDIASALQYLKSTQANMFSSQSPFFRLNSASLSWNPGMSCLPTQLLSGGPLFAANGSNWTQNRLPIILPFAPYCPIRPPTTEIALAALASLVFPSSEPSMALPPKRLSQNQLVPSSSSSTSTNNDTINALVSFLEANLHQSSSSSSSSSISPPSTMLSEELHFFLVCTLATVVAKALPQDGAYHQSVLLGKSPFATNSAQSLHNPPPPPQQHHNTSTNSASISHMAHNNNTNNHNTTSSTSSSSVLGALVSYSPVNTAATTATNPSGLSTSTSLIGSTSTNTGGATAAPNTASQNTSFPGIPSTSSSPIQPSGTSTHSTPSFYHPLSTNPPSHPTYHPAPPPQYPSLTSFSPTSPLTPISTPSVPPPLPNAGAAASSGGAALVPPPLVTPFSSTQTHPLPTIPSSATLQPQPSSAISSISTSNTPSTHSITATTVLTSPSPSTGGGNGNVSAKNPPTQHRTWTKHSTASQRSISIVAGQAPQPMQQLAHTQSYFAPPGGLVNAAVAAAPGASHSTLHTGSSSHTSLLNNPQHSNPRAVPPPHPAATFQASSKTVQVYQLDDNNVCYPEGRQSSAYSGSHPMEVTSAALRVDPRCVLPPTSQIPMSILNDLELMPHSAEHIECVKAEDFLPESGLAGFALQHFMLNYIYAPLSQRDSALYANESQRQQHDTVQPPQDMAILPRRPPPQQQTVSQDDVTRKKTLRRPQRQTSHTRTPSQSGTVQQRTSTTRGQEDAISSTQTSVVAGGSTAPIVIESSTPTAPTSRVSTPSVTATATPSNPVSGSNHTTHPPPPPPPPSTKPPAMPVISGPAGGQPQGFLDYIPSSSMFSPPTPSSTTAFPSSTHTAHSSVASSTIHPPEHDAAISSSHATAVTSFQHPITNQTSPSSTTLPQILSYYAIIPAALVTSSSSVTAAAAAVAATAANPTYNPILQDYHRVVFVSLYLRPEAQEAYRCRLNDPQSSPLYPLPTSKQQPLPVNRFVYCACEVLLFFPAPKRNTVSATSGIRPPLPPSGPLAAPVTPTGPTGLFSSLLSHHSPRYKAQQQQQQQQQQSKSRSFFPSSEAIPPAVPATTSQNNEITRPSLPIIAVIIIHHIHIQLAPQVRTYFDEVFSMIFDLRQTEMYSLFQRVNDRILGLSRTMHQYLVPARSGQSSSNALAAANHQFADPLAMINSPAILNAHNNTLTYKKRPMASSLFPGVSSLTSQEGNAGQQNYALVLAAIASATTALAAFSPRFPHLYLYLFLCDQLALNITHLVPAERVVIWIASHNDATPAPQRVPASFLQPPPAAASTTTGLAASAGAGPNVPPSTALHSPLPAPQRSTGTSKTSSQSHSTTTQPFSVQLQQPPTTLTPAPLLATPISGAGPIPIPPPTGSASNSGPDFHPSSLPDESTLGSQPAPSTGSTNNGPWNESVSHADSSVFDATLLTPSLHQLQTPSFAVTPSISKNITSAFHSSNLPYAQEFNFNNTAHNTNNRSANTNNRSGTASSVPNTEKTKSSTSSSSSLPHLVCMFSSVAQQLFQRMPLGAGIAGSVAQTLQPRYDIVLDGATGYGDDDVNSLLSTAYFPSELMGLYGVQSSPGQPPVTPISSSFGAGSGYGGTNTTLYPSSSMHSSSSLSPVGVPMNQPRHVLTLPIINPEDNSIFGVVQLINRIDTHCKSSHVNPSLWKYFGGLTNAAVAAAATSSSTSSTNGGTDYEPYRRPSLVSFPQQQRLPTAIPASREPRHSISNNNSTMTLQRHAAHVIAQHQNQLYQQRLHEHSHDFTEFSTTDTALLQQLFVTIGSLFNDCANLLRSRLQAIRVSIQSFRISISYKPEASWKRSIADFASRIAHHACCEFVSIHIQQSGASPICATTFRRDLSLAQSEDELVQYAFTHRQSILYNGAMNIFDTRYPATTSPICVTNPVPQQDSSPQQFPLQPQPFVMNGTANSGMYLPPPPPSLPPSAQYCPSNGSYGTSTSVTSKSSSTVFQHPHNHSILIVHIPHAVTTIVVQLVNKCVPVPLSNTSSKSSSRRHNNAAAATAAAAASATAATNIAANASQALNPTGSPSLAHQNLEYSSSSRGIAQQQIPSGPDSNSALVSTISSQQPRQSASQQQQPIHDVSSIGSLSQQRNTIGPDAQDYELDMLRDSFVSTSSTTIADQQLHQFPANGQPVQFLGTPGLGPIDTGIAANIHQQQQYPNDLTNHHHHSNIRPEINSFQAPTDFNSTAFFPPNSAYFPPMNSITGIRRVNVEGNNTNNNQSSGVVANTSGPTASIVATQNMFHTVPLHSHSMGTTLHPQHALAYQHSRPPHVGNVPQLAVNDTMFMTQLPQSSNQFQSTLMKQSELFPTATLQSSGAMGLPVGQPQPGPFNLPAAPGLAGLVPLNTISAPSHATTNPVHFLENIVFQFSVHDVKIVQMYSRHLLEWIQPLALLITLENTSSTKPGPQTAGSTGEVTKVAQEDTHTSMLALYGHQTQTQNNPSSGIPSTTSKRATDRRASQTYFTMHTATSALTSSSLLSMSDHNGAIITPNGGLLSPPPSNVKLDQSAVKLPTLAEPGHNTAATAAAAVTSKTSMVPMADHRAATMRRDRRNSIALVENQTLRYNLDSSLSRNTEPQNSQQQQTAMSQKLSSHYHQSQQHQQQQSPPQQPKQPKDTSTTGPSNESGSTRTQMTYKTFRNHSKERTMSYGSAATEMADGLEQPTNPLDLVQPPPRLNTMRNHRMSLDGMNLAAVAARKQAVHLARRPSLTPSPMIASAGDHMDINSIDNTPESALLPRALSPSALQQQQSNSDLHPKDVVATTTAELVDIQLASPSPPGIPHQSHVSIITSSPSETVAGSSRTAGETTTVDASADASAMAAVVTHDEQTLSNDSPSSLLSPLPTSLFPTHAFALPPPHPFVVTHGADEDDDDDDDAVPNHHHNHLSSSATEVAFFPSSQYTRVGAFNNGQFPRVRDDIPQVSLPDHFSLQVPVFVTSFDPFVLPLPPTLNLAWPLAMYYDSLVEPAPVAAAATTADATLNDVATATDTAAAVSDTSILQDDEIAHLLAHRSRKGNQSDSQTLSLDHLSVGPGDGSASVTPRLAPQNSSDSAKTPQLRKNHSASSSSVHASPLPVTQLQLHFNDLPHSVSTNHVHMITDASFFANSTLASAAAAATAGGSGLNSTTTTPTTSSRHVQGMSVSHMELGDTPRSQTHSHYFQQPDTPAALPSSGPMSLEASFTRDNSTVSAVVMYNAPHGTQHATASISNMPGIGSRDGKSDEEDTYIVDRRASSTLSSISSKNHHSETDQLSNTGDFFLRGNSSHHHAANVKIAGKFLASLFSPFTSSRAQKQLSPLKFAMPTLNHFDHNVMDICVVIYNTLVSIGFLAIFQCHYTTLQAFIMAVCSLYRNNSFHNFKHAFSVFQFCYVMLVHTSSSHQLPPLVTRRTTRQGTSTLHLELTPYTLQQRLHGEGWLLPRFEACLVLIASLCHDIDHPGNTNQYETTTQSRLALLHNNHSILENHHSMITTMLIKQPQCNIFYNIPKNDQIHAHTFLIECILATDMEHHFATIQKLAALHDANALSLAVPYAFNPVTNNDIPRYTVQVSSISPAANVANGNEVALSSSSSSPSDPTTTTLTHLTSSQQPRRLTAITSVPSQTVLHQLTLPISVAQETNNDNLSVGSDDSISRTSSQMGPAVAVDLDDDGYLSYVEQQQDHDYDDSSANASYIEQYTNQSRDTVSQREQLRSHGSQHVSDSDPELLPLEIIGDEPSGQDSPTFHNVRATVAGDEAMMKSFRRTTYQQQQQQQHFLLPPQQAGNLIKHDSLSSLESNNLGINSSNNVSKVKAALTPNPKQTYLQTRHAPKASSGKYGTMIGNYAMYDANETASTASSRFGGQTTRGNSVTPVDHSSTHKYSTMIIDSAHNNNNNNNNDTNSNYLLPDQSSQHSARSGLSIHNDKRHHHGGHNKIMHRRSHSRHSKISSKHSSSKTKQQNDPLQSNQTVPDVTLTPPIDEITQEIICDLNEPDIVAFIEKQALTQPILAKFQQQQTQGVVAETQRKKDILFFSQILIHSSDLCGQALPLNVALAWEQCISEEFSQQHCNEQRLGLDSLPFLRDLHILLTRCKGQVGFVSYVLIPWWQQLARLWPSLLCFLQQAEHNNKHYAHIVSIIEAQRKAQEIYRQSVASPLSTSPAPSSVNSNGTSSPTVLPAPPKPAEFRSFYPVPTALPPPSPFQTSGEGLSVPCDHHGHWITIVPHIDMAHIYNYITPSLEADDQLPSFSEPVSSETSSTTSSLSSSSDTSTISRSSDTLHTHHLPAISHITADKRLVQYRLHLDYYGENPLDEMLYNISIHSQPALVISSSNRQQHSRNKNKPLDPSHPFICLSNRECVWKCCRRLQIIPTQYDYEKHGE